MLQSRRCNFQEDQFNDDDHDYNYNYDTNVASQLDKIPCSQVVVPVGALLSQMNHLEMD
jgi:hypothetical protein